MKRFNVESASGCMNCYAEEAEDGEYVEYTAAIEAVRLAEAGVPLAIAGERERCSGLVAEMLDGLGRLRREAVAGSQQLREIELIIQPLLAVQAAIDGGGNV